MQVNIGAAQTENSLTEKLLDVTIDAKLSFEKHIYANLWKSKGKVKSFSKNCSLNKHPGK